MSRPGSEKNDLRGADADLLKILALQSGDPRRIRGALSTGQAPPPSLIPHVIQLLGVDGLANDAMRALRDVAASRPGALIDALIDVRLPAVLRRRLARVMSVCQTPDVVNALLQGIDDEHRGVRVQCARSLFLIRRRHPDLVVDRERVMTLIQNELDAAAEDVGFVFALLALVYPATPIRVAYRSLRGSNLHARGFAIEYLRGILPVEVGEKLVPVVARMGGRR